MSEHKVSEEVGQYLADIAAAQSEEAKKLRFQNLLLRLFGDSAASRALVNQMAAGGERTIFNIPRKGRPKTGYADIAYSNVIIEWEKDLGRTGRHAEDQLAEYLAGKWHSGERYDFVLLATDGRVWRRYAPQIEILLAQEQPSRMALRKVEEFEVKPDNEQRFFYFLDSVLFRTQVRKATLSDIQLDFGDTSRAFINTVQAMGRVVPARDVPSPVHVAFEQWQRFLQLAYGRFDDRTQVYLVHTYLSAFAKLLAYAVLRPSAHPSDDELLAVLNGQAFDALNVQHFVEGDFFYWISDPGIFAALAPALRELFNQIREYDFTDVEEDILKGVYQELIDIDTRHSLGEYYTPDWLCERVVSELHLERHYQVLDPACGSGSFLRALVSRFRKQWPEMTAQQLCSQINGIDVHPLSVQIAKTTLLLALGDTVARADSPVALHVYLANTLFLSEDEGRRTLYSTGHHFRVSVDKQQLALDVEPFLGQPESFAKAIELAQHFVESQLGTEVPAAVFGKALQNRVPGVQLQPHQEGELYAVYRAMRKAKLAGRDSIWQFVLQNLYQPVFMLHVFDAIVANPPWLTYSDMTSGDYQQQVAAMARFYGLAPASKANNPHIDLAALFLAHCGQYLAKDGAQLAFVLPRAFLTADQHDNVRSGQARGFKLTEVWDLAAVKPLFNVPACVWLASAVQSEGDAFEAARRLPPNGIVGRVFAGRLPRPHMHWAEAEAAVGEAPTRWYFQTLGGSGKRAKRSALVQKRLADAGGINAYADRFKQGATIVPRAFYFVAVPGTPMESPARRVLPVQTHQLAVDGAKKPWVNIALRGKMQGKYLFRTALARNVLPFALVNPPLVALPLAVRPDTGKWELLNAAELTARGDLEAAQWFGQCELLWAERRSESATSKSTSMLDWLDYQKKLTQQPVGGGWAVLFNRSAKDGNACSLDIRAFDRPFIADFSMYVCFVETQEEAHFIECYLNCAYINRGIKEFQTTGHFGERDVTKKILEFPWPNYSPSNAHHRHLATLGHRAASQVRALLGNTADLELDARTLGRERLRVRAHIAPLMMEIDAMVKAISLSTEPPAMPSEGWTQLLTHGGANGGEADDAALSEFLRAERAEWAPRTGSDGSLPPQDER